MAASAPARLSAPQPDVTTERPPQSILHPRSPKHSRSSVAGRRSSARSTFRTLRGYLNTTLSTLLAFLISIGGGSVRGTYAYFTNTQNITNNVFSTSTLQPPTGLIAVQQKNSVYLTWSASSSSYVSGYDVYRKLSTDASFPGTPIGSTAAGVTAYTDTPPTSGATYNYRVSAKAGATGAW
ncbi:MAG TPA: hypothetical protein VGW38_21585, partial [Chloroflexota bacterium]|nr:hypothetical protein [Chloroflexota bacterium]